MKFWVRRTSNWDDGVSPLRGAVKENTLCTSHGSWKTLEAARREDGCGWFFREGTLNHRKVAGGVAHDYYADRWSIEVPSLEVLIALIEEEGRVVVDTGNDLYGNGPTLEIYDGYRE